MIGAFNAPPHYTLITVYYVYILHSNKGKKLQIGSTPDLKLRFKKHTTGFVRSTKNRRPLQLIYYESYLLRIDALRREKYLKSGAGRKELAKQLESIFDELNYKYSK